MNTKARRVPGLIFLSRFATSIRKTVVHSANIRHYVRTRFTFTAS